MRYRAWQQFKGIYSKGQKTTPEEMREFRLEPQRKRSMSKPIPLFEIKEAKRRVDNEPKSQFVGQRAHRVVRGLHRSLANKEGGDRLWRQAWTHASR